MKDFFGGKIQPLGIDLICVEEGNVGNYYDLAKNIKHYDLIKKKK